MHAELGVPVSFKGIVSMTISGGTILSSLFSDKLTRKFSTRIVTVASVFLTVIALFGFERTNLLMKASLFKTIYVMSDLWQSVGWGSIVYLAALTAIDSSLYEAAMLDGAGRLKQTIYVTIPGIAPTVVTMLILRLGAIMSVGAEKIILLYNPTTYETAETISTYVYQKGLVNINFSYSTAIGLFNSVINLVLLLAANKISKKYTEVGLW